MKKLNQIKRGLLVASFLLGAAILPMACQQEEVITLPADGGFLITLQEEALDVTRSTPAELGKPLAIQFHLKVEKEGGGVIYNQLYTDQLIAASAGRYNLTATYGENVPLAWDAPYYEGTAQAEVTQGTTPVTLPCRVANALLSVKYSKPELFNQVYSQYYVSVNVENSSLQISQAEEKQSAYFRAGQPLTVTFHGTLKEGAKEVTTDLTGLLKEKLQLKDELILQAADHAKLTLAASNTVLKVEKLEIKKETIQETIPQEWLPKPKVSGFGEGTTTLQYVETNAAMPAAIAFTASTPIQDAEFTLSLEDEQFTSLNGSYTLSTLSQEQRTQLESVGIQPPYIGEKNGSFNLTHLTARLQTNAGATTSNRITFRVKANNRWSAEADAIPTYTIETLKPEFSVSIQPGNIWTKEFTVDEITVAEGKGDIEKIKSKLVYQFSSNNGSSWEDFSQGTQHLFGTWPLERNYQIRAVYRKEIPSVNTAEANLEEPVQLPNSDMNRWTYEMYGGSYYSFMPYNDEIASTWDTNNIFTTRHRHNAGITRANYNGFHAVSYVPGRGGNGYAAELRSTANGRGNTRFFSAHTEQTYNKVAGELYTGTAKITMGGTDANGGNDVYERIKDVEHTSRPTGLKFYYQYMPYQTDSWKVHLELLDADKKVIIEKDYQSAETKSDWTEIVVPLEYTAENSLTKCHYIYIIFSSTISPGDSMPYREITQTFYVDNQKHDFKPAYVGSVLCIDDITLIYDK